MSVGSSEKSDHNVIGMALVFGKVVGQFLAEVGDSADPDLDPDLVPLAGTITFKPAIAFLLSPALPATILPVPIVCTLDNDGFLTYNSEQGVWLQATDDPSVNPTNWTYQVSFALNLNGTALGYAPFNIQVPHGQTIDLTTVTPVASGGGVLTVQGPKGDPGTNGVPIVVLGPSDPVPSGTPAGAIIIRTAA